MANVDAPRGFILARSGGKEPRRVRRSVDSANARALAIGDGYLIEADGNVTRCDTGEAPNGIVESIELGAKSNEGPESLDYLPAATAGNIIGIEDEDAEFECQIDNITLAGLDAGQTVALVDAAPDTSLRQSRQSVDTLGGGDLALVGLVNRPDNAYGDDAKVLVKLLDANVI